ncbi:MAG: ATP synthase epsilon chain [Alphaproteobacteria bacterium MarineAlpha5_Bin9]|nr:MAG: ATP synthase epsilon chain [Alphaproteobacteria bacterium MarineAlpha5_Bin9]|tara:strand:+ start:22386 stop:22787 length:402 start_codon:yes stop_codon:yes gene_type:complete
MENFIAFDLVSPETLIFSDEVGLIIVPGEDGDIGVLPGHSKVISSLRPGRVLVYGKDKNLLKSFFVSGGFVEINPNKCIVLGEEVFVISDLNKDNLKKQLDNIEKDKSEKKLEEHNKINLMIKAIDAEYYLKI